MDQQPLGGGIVHSETGLDYSLSNMQAPSASVHAITSRGTTVGGKGELKQGPSYHIMWWESSHVACQKCLKVGPHFPAKRLLKLERHACPEEWDRRGMMCW